MVSDSVYLCVYRDTPVFCSLINGEGEVVDFLRLPYFLKRRNAWREDEREKKVKKQKPCKSFTIQLFVIPIDINIGAFKTFVCCVSIASRY